MNSRVAEALHIAPIVRDTARSMDSDRSSESFIESSRFDTLVRTRTWEWLDALCRRLHLDVQLVDPHSHSGLPANLADQTALARLVASRVPEVRTLASAAATRRTRQIAVVQGLRISAYPLSDRSDAVGVVLIAYPISGRRGNVEEPIGLEIAAQSIVLAIQAHLQTTPVPARGSSFDDVALLGHVLDATAAHGTDREIMSAFAAALAFWKRVDVYGYVMTTDGMFAAEVSPPVPARAQMPANIPMGSLPPASMLTPLSRAQIQALGITHGPDVLVARIPDGEFPWLIVFCGAISRAEAARLGLYVRLLDQLVRTVVSEATIKLVCAMSSHLLEHGDAASDAASAAVDALNASTGMASSALKVTTVYGAPLMQVGHMEPRQGDVSGGSRLVIIRRVPNRYTLTVVLTSAEGRRITRQQREVADAAANLLDAWVRSVLGRLQQHDRRTASRTFDEVLDRFAGQAIERGSAVSMVVLLMADAACYPGLTQQWIGRIRGTMRASDIVGMLGEGEIALLLHDTALDRAEAVAQRIVKVLETIGDHHPSPVVATGVASRLPGSAGGAGLAAEARNDAMRRATASLSHPEPRSS
jgi:hypothetical protein